MILDGVIIFILMLGLYFSIMSVLYYKTTGTRGLRSLFSLNSSPENHLKALFVYCAVVIGLIYFGFNSTGSSTEYLNGQVTGKYRDEVSCEHSYPCNCDSKGNCSVCYEHFEDYDWIVTSTAGDITIDRIDDQGEQEPPRWTSVQNGEAVVIPHRYFNYIRASGTTVFNLESVEEIPLPPYPMRIHDVYRADRVFKWKLSNDVDVAGLNNALNETLKTLGPSKRVNIGVILHSETSLDFPGNVRTKLLGGNFNDVIVLIGLDPDNKITSVNAFSWSKTDLLHTLIEDDLKTLGTYDPQMVATIITGNISKHFSKMHQDDFEYLDASISLPQWALWGLCVLGIFFPILAFLFVGTPSVRRF